MANSSIIGTPPATARDQLILQGMYAYYNLPLPAKNAWKVLSRVDPNTTGLPHDSHGPRMLAGISVGMLVIFVVTSMRLYSRWRGRSSALGLDDFFIIWAAAAGLTWLSVQTAMITQGDLGKHAWDCTYEEQYMLQKLGHVDILIFITYSCLTKISIAFFNWRLTGVSSTKWRRVHIACLTLSICYGVESLLVYLFQCRPVSASFSLIMAGRPGADYRCHINTLSFGYSLQSLHIIIDWILLAIPVIIIWRLQIPVLRKVQATVPLSFGLLSCVATVLRFWCELHYADDDPLYNFIHQSDWSIIDVVVTICVTSLPSCNALVVKEFRAHFPSKSSKNSSKSTEVGQKLSFTREEKSGISDAVAARKMSGSTAILSSTLTTFDNSSQNLTEDCHNHDIEKGLEPQKEGPGPLG